MQSKWFNLKNAAIKFRKKGFSIGKIEKRLGIPRSTLSGWLKNIALSPQQKTKLTQDWKNALIKARKKAVKWHNTQKQKRLLEAKRGAKETLKRIGANNEEIIELALAMLYLGEGSKKNQEVSIGSSNPLILKFFLSALKTMKGFDNQRVKCQLSLRFDQNPVEMQHFWSGELKIPIDKFGYTALDKRTAGSKTYPSYKGVCQIHCGNVAIQRKLLFISEEFCKKIVKKYLGV